MNPIYNPREIEEEIMKFWLDKKIYAKLKKLRQKQKTFFFMDGPPYATGSIHMGTAWNKIIKDSYLRFWRMQGFNVRDQPGYDTHGTPIEYQVEKELGFSSKKDIEAYGVDKFIAKCRDFATKYINVMSQQFANLGVWMDWERPYLTLDNRYIEGAWYTFSQAFQKGFLYKDKYPVHVCPRCETVVSYNEIEYRKLTDPSVFVKFKIKGTVSDYFLIWTTTPWTLPANTGIMVHPTYDYAFVKVGRERLVIAKDLVDTVMAKAKITGYSVTDVVKGKALEGKEYDHPLRDLVTALQKLKGAHRVVTSSRYVTLEDGTGLVHTAPGHGMEDYHVGQKEGLPALSPVEEDGTFTKAAGPWLYGKFARASNGVIIEKLSDHKALFKKEDVTHDYPVCWRCEEPLLQISIPQWFFKVSTIRDKLIEQNSKVVWTPKWASDRFKDWLQNLGDWPISRQRYWGIPLPIWECGCGHVEVIGSFEELKLKSGLKSEIDFHRPAIDAVTMKCPKCGKAIKRVPDVLDVWFDSGVGTWASLNYPRQKEPFASIWPSEFQTEGPDQFRGWWNSEMITSVITFDKAPFKNIMLHGFVLDAKGSKMSKSKGNAVSPDDVIKKYGRDILRYYLLNSAPWDDFYFNWENVGEVNKLFQVFWNVAQFIKTYANDEDIIKAVEKGEQASVLSAEDRWIISRVNSLAAREKEVKQYKIHMFVQDLNDFILSDFSRWYIKVIRNRVSPWHSGSDKPLAQYTLLYVMNRILRMMAPITPFLADYMYRELFTSAESVHLCTWPAPESAFINEQLEKEMKVARDIVEGINAMRQEKKMRLKWPLADVTIAAKDKSAEGAVKSLAGIIQFMGNVKEVKTGKAQDMIDFPFGSLALGPVLKDEALVRELIRFIQVLRKKEHLKVGDHIKLWVDSDGATLEIIRQRLEEVSKGVGASEINLGPVKNQKGTIAFEDKSISVGFKA
jgi:isoleucyl-tRNA synthetase